MGLHQLTQKCYPVHTRHLDIERQHIGFQLNNLVAGNIRVRSRPYHLYTAVLIDRYDFFTEVARFITAAEAAWGYHRISSSFAWTVGLAFSRAW